MTYSSPELIDDEFPAVDKHSEKPAAQGEDAVEVAAHEEETEASSPAYFHVEIF